MRKLLVIVAVLMMMVSACAPRPKTTYLLGDSISFLALAEWQTAKQAHGWTGEDNAIPGITIQQSMPKAQEYAAKKPDIVVINLGTNNRSLDIDETKNAYVEMAKLFPDSCVVVTTITEISQRPEWATAMNGWLRNDPLLESTFGVKKVLTADWADVLRRHPEYVPDGVHPGGPGVQSYVDTITTAADRC